MRFAEGSDDGGIEWGETVNIEDVLKRLYGEEER